MIEEFKEFIKIDDNEFLRVIFILIAVMTPISMYYIFFLSYLTFDIYVFLIYLVFFSGPFFFWYFFILFFVVYDLKKRIKNCETVLNNAKEKYANSYKKVTQLDKEIKERKIVRLIPILGNLKDALHNQDNHLNHHIEPYKKMEKVFNDILKDGFLQSELSILMIFFYSSFLLSFLFSRTEVYYISFFLYNVMTFVILTSIYFSYKYRRIWRISCLPAYNILRDSEKHFNELLDFEKKIELITSEKSQ